MKPPFFVAAFLIFLAPCAVLPQQDALTPFEKCRLVTPSDLSEKGAPAFASRRDNIRGMSGHPKLDLSNPTARYYRTWFRSEVAKGPNYAGHYRVVVWGCGTSCAMFAVVNLNTGGVIEPDGFRSINTVYFADEEFVSNPKRDYWGFDFRRDSRLLVVIGGLDEDEEREGAFYFRWNTSNFV